MAPRLSTYFREASRPGVMEDEKQVLQDRLDDAAKVICTRAELVTITGQGITILKRPVAAPVTVTTRWRNAPQLG